MTTSVVCRAYDAEAPYIKSFIEHYLKIGVTEFHIVVPTGNKSGILQSVINEYDCISFYADHGLDCNFNEVQNIALPNIKTSHFLFVDIDEFLDIDDISTLTDYDYIRLNWVIAPYFMGSSGDWVLGFPDRQAKYMARTELCRKINIHDFELITDNIKYHESENKLIHYVYRSYSDLFLKCAISNYQSYQQSQYEQLSGGVNHIRALPVKYKAAAIYQRIALSSNLKYPRYYYIDEKLENKLVQNSGMQDLYSGLEASYLQYMSSIDMNSFIKNLFRNEKYQEYGRVPHYLLSSIVEASLSDEINPERWIRTGRKPGLYTKLRNLISRGIKSEA